MPRRSARRRFLTSAAALAGAILTDGCADARAEYAASVRRSHRPLGAHADPLELVRYATLAANDHNAQAWRFRVREPAIHVVPDFRRRLAVADPHDRQLYASLGCAIENLSIATRARGGSGAVACHPEGWVEIDLSAARPIESALFRAIPERRVTRGPYAGGKLSRASLARLCRAGCLPGTELVPLSESAARRRLSAPILAARAAARRAPGFDAELLAWTRFDAASALTTRDGLYAGCSGASDRPPWLGRLLFEAKRTEQRAREHDLKALSSASALFALFGERADPRGWIDVGRACQRLALQATVEGLAHDFVSCTADLSAAEIELRARLGVGPRDALMLMRVGHAAAGPHSLRRPVGAVLI